MKVQTNTLKKIVSVFFIFMLFLPAGLKAETYYLATDGLDTNDGTKENPWSTFEHALTMLQAGDTLYIREGVYYQRSLNIGLQGTQSEPIVITSYPGEQAALDGGIPDFRDAPNELWELVDAGINLYRSKQTYSQSSFMSAWLLDDDTQIIGYSHMENLTSTNYGPMSGFNPMFVGPGILHHSDDHLYIRLEYNPNDLIDHDGNDSYSIPSDLNPNNLSIAVFFTERLFQLSQGSDSASHIQFKNLHIRFARNLFNVLPGTDNILFDGCTFMWGRFAFNFRENGGSNFEFRNNEFNNGLPDYVYWTDVKNRSREVHEAYPTFQSAAMNGHMVDFYIHNNLFRDIWEAIYVSENSRNVKVVHNHFIRLRDDAITYRITRDSEFAYNVIWKTGLGVSNAFNPANNANSGHIYIHHNVFYNTFRRGGRPGNFNESVWPQWQVGGSFGRHGSGNYPAWWKVYNNTVITRQSARDHRHTGPLAIIPNEEYYIYNNIFKVLDHRIIFANAHVSSGAHFDGNVMYRVNPQNPSTYPLFQNFGDGGDYLSLHEFRQNSGTHWEINGLETDPGIDVEKIHYLDYDPDTMWERFAPSNPRVLTPGASYEGLNWPGVEGVTYRGAVNMLTGDATTFEGGTGSLEDPFQIKTLEQLQEVRNYTDGKFYFIQIADIDASGTEDWNEGQGFQPIGDAGLIFTGSYDGNGFKISGLTIHRGDYVGLFGQTDGALLENIRLKDITVSGRYAVGGLTGHSNNTEINNSSVIGNISGGHRVGGLAGWVFLSRINHSGAAGNVSGDGRVGGLVGLSDRSGINNSYARVEVAGGRLVGGLVGENTMDWRRDGQIATSYAAGHVTGDEDAGGFVGLNRATIESSFWDMDVSGQDQEIGRGDEGDVYGLTTSQMSGLNAFENMGGFNFKGSWLLTESYPALHWEDVEALEVPTSAEQEEKPVAYKLNQNYPNPFNSSTQITYSLPENTHVLIEVYNLLGQRITTLVNADKTAGRYNVTFDAANLASGIYIYKMHTTSFTETKQMMLIK